MPDSRPETNNVTITSKWNVESLKDYIDVILAERNHAVEKALTAADRNTILIERMSIIENRLETLVGNKAGTGQQWTVIMNIATLAMAGVLILVTFFIHH